MNLTYGSLCTGYDGIGMGLGLAGLNLEHLFYAETEPSVSEVLKLEHPEVPNLGDIKTATWPTGHVDILSSGDPCQSISIAGRKEGRNDPRFLWPWVREAYRQTEPDVILLENVANMTSHDGGRTMAERFDNLREDGYAVRWTVVGACAIGAPHHRHRWYAVAEWVGGQTPEAVRIGKAAHCGAPRSGGRTLLPTPSAADGSGGPGVSDKRLGGMNLRTAVTLLPTPCARDGEGRNEGSPEFWQRKYERMPDRIGNGIPLGAAVNLLPTPRACQSERWGRYAEAIALWESITGNPVPEPTMPGPNGGVRLNPALPEWMMGLRPGLLTERMSRNDALKAAGNGVVPLQAAAAWRMLT